MSSNQSTDSSIKFGAAYVRVSTNMQEELSPDAQKRLILEYAQKNNIIVSQDSIFIENGISGRKADKRPEFQKMIATAKSDGHPLDVILVWKFSRFARNQEESIVYKSLLKKQCNVDVISVSEPIIDGPFGSLIERIIEWMDEYYSTRLSGEVFRGMSEKALRGGFQSRPPLGYKIIQKGGVPVIVPEEAETVRLIFHKYVDDGMNLFSIVRYLNSLGLKTSHGKLFEKRSLEYIIQNPMYIGKIRWNRTENITNRIKDKEEWIIEDGQHEAILSEDLFNRAQERFFSEYHPKNAKPSALCKHWLSGVIKCSSCGRSLASSNQKYFQCYGYSKGKCSVSHSIPAKKAVNAILDIIKHDLESEFMEFEHLAANHDTTNALKLFEIQLSRISDKEARVKESYRSGVDTLEEYKENKALLLKERNQIVEQINALKSETLDMDEDEYQRKMRKKLQSIYDIIISDDFSVEQRNEAIKSIVSKIVYNKAKDSLQIFYYNNGIDI